MPIVCILKKKMQTNYTLSWNKFVNGLYIILEYCAFIYIWNVSIYVLDISVQSNKKKKQVIDWV